MSLHNFSIQVHAVSISILADGCLEYSYRLSVQMYFVYICYILDVYNDAMNEHLRGVKERKVIRKEMLFFHADFFLLFRTL